VVIRECGYVPAFGSSFIQVFVGDRQLRTGFGGHVLAGKKPWLQQGAVNLKDTVSLFPLNLKKSDQFAGLYRKPCDDWVAYSLIGDLFTNDILHPALIAITSTFVTVQAPKRLPQSMPRQQRAVSVSAKTSYKIGIALIGRWCLHFWGVSYLLLEFHWNVRLGFAE
jgi:hypothetical protein